MRWTLAAVLAVPVVEIAVVIEVGRRIGAGWTVLALLAVFALGVIVVRRAGSTLGRVNGQLLAGEVPGRELADDAIVFAAGFLLVVPGFVTGAAGLLLLLPPLRAVARRPLERVLARAAADRSTFGWSSRGPGAGPGPDVIEGEIVDE